MVVVGAGVMQGKQTRPGREILLALATTVVLALVLLSARPTPTTLLQPFGSCGPIDEETTIGYAPDGSDRLGWWGRHVGSGSCQAAMLDAPGLAET
jgi:hypothetical protein